MPKVLIPKEVNIDNITYIKGEKNTTIKYNGDNFQIQTPQLSCPFGISKYDKNISIVLQLKKTDKLYDVISKLEEKIQRDDKSGKLFISCIKVKEPYDPNFRLKIPTSMDSGEITIRGFDENEQRIDIMKIEKRSNVIAIFECENVWYSREKYGINYKVKQMQVFKPTMRYQEKITGFAFRKNDDDSKKSKFAIRSDSPKPVKSKKVEKTTVVEPKVKEEPVVEKVEEPILEKVEPVIEKVEEPIVEKVEEPIVEKVEEPVVEKVKELVVEKVEEKVEESVVEKVEELVVEKVVEEPVVEKVEEPVVEKVEEKVEEPVEEKVEEEEGCQGVLKSGKNKGNMCYKKTVPGTNFCKRHS